MMRVVPIAVTFTAKALQTAAVVLQADETKAAVAALVSAFFASMAFHSTAQFFNWPFEGSCRLVEIPTYFLLTGGSAALSFATARIAYLKLKK